MDDKKPRAIIIAGPNGSGKTTFAREFLTHEAGCPVFINADLIATGLSPFQPELVALQASRLMIQVIDAHVRRRDNFAVETTLAAQSYMRRVKEWQEVGYSVKLIFLWLPTADLAIERVALRVAQGGHNIEEPVIRRRYHAGLANLEEYKRLVDHWQVIDSSGESPVLIDEGKLS